MKFVYAFSEGNKNMSDLLGGKGANLAEMTKIGLPIPNGFTVTTKACAEYIKNKGFPKGLTDEIKKHVKKIERDSEKKFGQANNFLLFSVRSGAKISMPGMMDTVLNLGLNDKIVEELVKKYEPKFIYDIYRRFLQMFGDVVLGIEHDKFEEALESVKDEAKVKLDTDLSVEDLKEVIKKYKKIYSDSKKKLPEDPYEQLKMSVEAVFSSWNNDRAIAYREINNIPHDLYTAVNIQLMVYGNLNDNSYTGVAFTRNPATGDKEFYGEFLQNAQGEDVVAGIRTPKPMSQLEKVVPKQYKEFSKYCEKLEKHFKDMQDLEFTIQDSKLYILQTRNGKRTARAAIKIAVDMVDEKLITREAAITRIDAEQLNQFLQPVFNTAEKQKAIIDGKLLAKGLNAGPGAACGQIYFDAKDAEKAVSKKKDVILVRRETSPEDIRGMAVSKGILTVRGGMTSHAALVARQMGKVCVVGCDTITIKYQDKKMLIKDKEFSEGDWISLDGTTGEVIEGKIDTKPSYILRALEGKISLDKSPDIKYYKKIIDWSKKLKKLEVHTNADQPDQAKTAILLGAEGIGLCRTEHMFFGEDKIDAVREMILADNVEDRKKALDKIRPLQEKDFINLFKTLEGKPIVIRLLDPPLHEFLPQWEEDIKKLSKKIKVPVDKIKSRIKELHESNPMIGHRGCRLAISYPEIYEMQARAIFKAALKSKEKGIKPFPRIEIPLVGNVKELTILKEVIEQVAKETGAKGKIKYHIGVMLEVARACITANEIAQEADFMSFGTNDLTQTTLGFSRDDSGRFLRTYVEKGIYSKDPFQSIDQEGVGRVMAYAVKKARELGKYVDIGICGEHGGEPESVKFCHRIGLDSVSCSPFRVPIAIVAAAQAAIFDTQNA